MRPVWVAALSLLGLVSSFNLDTKNAVVHHKPGIKFGYALDFFYEQRNLPLLMVGAPEAETQNPKLRGIRRAGAVYGCSPTHSGTCKEIYADRDEGNERRLNGSVLVPIEDKSNQFFGGTVVASAKHDKLMMCAPQYKYFFTKFEVIEPVGACFYLETGSTEAFELSSCRQDNQKHGRHRLGYGQCGFSAAVPSSGGRSFIGGPGMFYWQGGVFSQANGNYSDRLNSSYSPKEYDHDMLGYATATGHFDGDETQDAVAGAPRGDDLTGKLVLYTSTLKHITNLTDTSSSPQTGQYCGHSIAVTDLNKDGRDDIITGCPFFTDYVTVVDAKTQERKPQYEVGKILVFMQTAPGVFSKPLVVIGDDQWGRFGFSIAAAGDLNQDGYNDIIVGAPHGGKDQRGAVYVIHGSSDGIRLKPTQKIEGASIGKDLKGFGFSVAGGIDIDGNGFPDVAAGAVKSGSALVMLSKPVVTLKGRTELDRDTVVVDDKNCEVDKELGQQSCRTIKTCFKYEGKGETPGDLDFVLTYNLDNLALEPRAHFISKDIRDDRTLSKSPHSKTKDHPNVIERRIRLDKGREKCFSQRFFVSSTMRDRLSPIHYTVNYTYEGSTTGRLRGGNLEPALDTTVPLSYDGKLSIANNCGDDGECVPNLGVTAKSDKPNFLLGTENNSIIVTVDVDNRGDDSFETKLFVDIPEGFDFGGVVATEGKTPPSCAPTTEKTGDHWLWQCDLGNPLPANKKTHVALRLEANEAAPPTDNVTIRAHVNSTNKEEESSLGDNRVEIVVPIEYKPSLLLSGKSVPDQIDFSTTNRSNVQLFDDKDLGPLVSHLYQVSNNGPSSMDVTLDIFWPSFSTHGQPLFYLIDYPINYNETKGQCRVKENYNVNPLNLRLVGEHLLTPPPPPIHEWSEESEERKEDGEGEVDQGHGGGDSHFVYTPSDTTKTEYKYIPDEIDDEEYEDEDEKRVKREEPRKRTKVAGKKRTGASPKGDTDKAKFSDLKEAVGQSKTSMERGQGGGVNYDGIVSRASVDCSALRCTHIECDLHDIGKGEFVLVEVHGRVATDTLVGEANQGGDVSSLALARVASNKSNKRQTMVLAVTTHLNAVRTEGAGGGIPWWLYLLAILIGLLILALLILLLWRCGFFKRNRPPTEKAARLATNEPDARYADRRTRYGGGQDPYDERGAML